MRPEVKKAAMTAAFAGKNVEVGLHIHNEFQQLPLARPFYVFVFEFYVKWFRGKRTVQHQDVQALFLANSRGRRELGGCIARLVQARKNKPFLVDERFN